MVSNSVQSQFEAVAYTLHTVLNKWFRIIFSPKLKGSRRLLRQEDQYQYPNNCVITRHQRRCIQNTAIACVALCPLKIKSAEHTAKDIEPSDVKAPEVEIQYCDNVPQMLGSSPPALNSVENPQPPDFRGWRGVPHSWETEQTPPKMVDFWGEGSRYCEREVWDTLRHVLCVQHQWSVVSYAHVCFMYVRYRMLTPGEFQCQRHPDHQISEPRRQANQQWI